MAKGAGAAKKKIGALGSLGGKKKIGGERAHTKKKANAKKVEEVKVARKALKKAAEKEAPAIDTETVEKEGKKAAKGIKGKARRLEEAQAAAPAKEAEEPKGVLYLGHLPKGFYEPQMRQFFNQFGKITRLRLSRSKKNAQSKGFAFIEFEEESVAKIVAETMDKYYLFGKTLVCHLVAKEKQHAGLFKNCRKKMINMTNMRRRKQKERYNNRPDVEVDGEKLPQTTRRQVKRRNKSDKKLGALLKTLEIDFDIGAGKSSPKIKPGSPKVNASSPKVKPGSPKVTPASPKVASKTEPEADKKRKATPEKSPAGKKKRKAA